jgi:predicted transposase YdaD
MDLSVNEKLDIIETEYHIPIEDSIRKDVSVMCNLSQGILEKGEARGKAIGEAKIILNMHKNGFTVEQIACATDKEEEEVRAIIEKREPVLA